MSYSSHFSPLRTVLLCGALSDLHCGGKTGLEQPELDPSCQDPRLPKILLAAYSSVLDGGPGVKVIFQSTNIDGVLGYKLLRASDSCENIIDRRLDLPFHTTAVLHGPVSGETAYSLVDRTVLHRGIYCYVVGPIVSTSVCDQFFPSASPNYRTVRVE